MPDRAELAHLEALLARAFVARDTSAALAAVESDPGLSEDLRARARGIDADGARIAALLIVRLRFERVIQGSRVGGEWFERDAREFAAAFKRYHAEVPPHTATPVEEGAAFDAWARPHRQVWRRR